MSKTDVPDKADFADQPPAKRRRVSGSDDQEITKSTALKLVFKTPGISILPRKPLLDVKNSATVAQVTQPSDGGVEGYYNVLW